MQKSVRSRMYNQQPRIFFKNVMILMMLLVSSIAYGQYTGSSPYCSDEGGLVINEMSQGSSGSQEFIELVVLGATSNPTAPVDLEGYIIDDNNFAASGNGTAAGHIKLGNCFSAILPGSIIVIYNGAQRDPSIPPDDPMDANSDRVYILNQDDPCLNVCESNPSTSNSMYCPCGGSPSPFQDLISMSNSNDLIQVRDRCEKLIHAVSYGGVSTTFTPEEQVVHVVTGYGNQSGDIIIFNNSDWNTLANFSNLPYAGNATPGAANNAANQIFINNCVNGSISCSGNIEACPLADAGDITVPADSPTPDPVIVICEGDDLGAFGNDYSAGDETMPSGTYSYDYAYVLVDGAGNIVAWNTTGDFDFSALPPDTYTIHGISYFSYTMPPTLADILNGSTTIADIAGQLPECFATIDIDHFDINGVSMDVEIIPDPTAIIPAIDPLCEADASNYDLTPLITIIQGGNTLNVMFYDGDPENGGILIDPITSVDLNNLNNGLWAVLGILGSCSDVIEIPITIVEELDLSTLDLGPYCILENPVTLPNPINGQSGTWSGVGVSSGTFDPGIAGIGTHTLTFTESVANCESTIEVEVIAEITPIFSIQDEYCEGEMTDILPTTSDNGLNGTWFPVSIDNTASASYVFTPASGECATSFTLDVIINPEITPTFSIQDEYCEGETTDILPTISDNGVNGTWNPTTIDNMTSGTYTFTPATGECASVYTLNVTINPEITPTFSIQDEYCEGETTDILPNTSDNGVNGTWNPVIIDNTASGTYVFTPESNTCASPYTLEVTITPMPAVNSINIIQCGTGGIATFDLTASEIDINSEPGAIFNWYEDAGLAVPINNPTAFVSPSIDVYVTVTIDGCTSEVAIVSLVVTDSPMLTLYDDIEICVGEELILFGQEFSGAGYEWTGPLGFYSTDLDALVSSVATVDMTGTYTFSVMLGDCPEVEETVDVIVHPSPEIEVVRSEIPLCYGDSAEITVNSLNGAILIDYDWDDNNYDGMNPITVTTSGTYTVTVTDDNTCMNSGEITVDFPEELVLDCSVVNHVSTPGGNDGLVNVNISGGTEPYLEIEMAGALNNTFPDPSAGDNMFSAMIEGTYTFTVTDANGCTASCELTINGPGCTITADVVVTDTILCHGDSSAVVYLDVDQYAGPLTYMWSDNLPPDSIQSGLPAGNYSVTITDEGENNCAITRDVTITEPLDLSLSCNYLPQDDSIRIISSGGTAPMSTIRIISPVKDTTIDNPELNITVPISVPGTYLIILEDANGCIDSCETIVPQDDCELDFDLVQVDSILCHGDSTAALNVNITAGTNTYSYSWDPVLPPTGIQTNLPAGTYSVTLTDESDPDCFLIKEIIIEQPEELTIQCRVLSEVSDVGQQDGQAEIIIGGGTQPYQSLSWSGPSSDNIAMPSLGILMIDNLSEGLYTFNFIDANGCNQTCTMMMTVAGCSLDAEIQQVDEILCFGDSTASLEIVNLNGLPPYRYKWSHDPSETGNPLNTLPAGSYRVTVTDDNDCDTVLNYDILEPELLVIDCNEVVDDSIKFIISGGTAPYTVKFVGPTSIDNIDFENAGSYGYFAPEVGEYTLVITDDNNCTTSCVIEVLPVSGCPFDIDITVLDSISCSGISDGRIEVNISPSSGSYIILWEDGSAGTVRSGLTAGTYTVIVEENGCRDTTQVTLVNSPEYEVELIGDSILCEGDSMLLSVDGDYDRVLWLPSGTITDNIKIKSPGTYSAIAINSQGCSDTVSIDIVELDTVMTFISDTLCGEDTLIINGTKYHADNPSGIEVFPGDNINICDSIVVIDLFYQSGGFMFEIIPAECGGPFETEVRLLPMGMLNAPYDIYVNGTFLETANNLPYTLNLINTGLQEISIIDAIGCEFRRLVNIERIIPFEVNVNGKTEIVIGDSSELIVTVEPDYDSLWWEPADLVSCSTCDTIITSPKEDQLFTVFVMDENGCITGTQVYILVRDGRIVYVPTAFSPNGDGINDTYLLYPGPGVRGFQFLRIFDRWGNRVYAEEYNKPSLSLVGWDGRFKGQTEDPAVFVVSALVIYEDGSSEYITKDISLLR